jgi:hypothetical protein
MPPPVLEAMMQSSLRDNQPRENTQISKHELLNEQNGTVDASIL